MSSQVKRGKIFVKRSRREVALFAEALLFLYYSKLLLIIPFKYAVKQIRPGQNQEVVLNEQNPQEFKCRLNEIRTAVRRADKFSFWSNICLVKSFAARFMLQRRGIPSTMNYGLIINGNKLEAHAWVTVGETEITPKGKTDFKIIHTL